MADIHTLFQTVKLPVMPEAAYALIRTLNDEDADIATVRDIIAKDPVLTTTLLRMANSALFGLSRSVTSLDKAVSVVGMSQIRARALNICMSQTFTLPEGVNRLEFWRYSMVCAGYARFLASKAGVDEHHAWLTATMLRLGELVLSLHHPDVIAPLEQLPRAPGERWARERALSGFDEGQITAEVARRWDFPAAIVEALAQCADGQQAARHSRLSAVVHLAGLWADQSADLASVRQAAAASSPAVWAHLGLDAQSLLPNLPDPEQFSDISALLQ
nr:HDOD domain-containing protein [uncultured Rhodoferax sp.]